MADGAISITKVINEVRGMFYFHMMFNVKKKLFGIDKKISKKIKKYLSNIPQTIDEDVFDYSLILLCEKIEKYSSTINKKFIEYFIL